MLFRSGTCRCADRINYAIQNHRIDPSHQDYTVAEEIAGQTLLDVKEAMEEIDDLAQHFSFAKLYATPEQTRQFMRNFLNSTSLSVVRNA